MTRSFLSIPAAAGARGLMGVLRRRGERADRAAAHADAGMRALQAELAAQAEAMRQAQDIRRHVLSHLTHEFRTPVNSILSLTQFLLDRSDGDLTPEQERQITLIRMAGERLSVMINNVLDLAAGDAQRIELASGACRADEIFEALRGIFAPVMTGGAVALHIDAPAGLPAFTGDQARIVQILRQLIMNAVKYTEAGRIDVGVCHDPARRMMVFHVADTGPGVAASEHERIFSAAAPAGAGGAHRNKGAGLGLPLARRLAEAMGGTIAIDSSPGSGARFTVTLPAPPWTIKDTAEFQGTCHGG